MRHDGGVQQVWRRRLAHAERNLDQLSADISGYVLSDSISVIHAVEGNHLVTRLGDCRRPPEHLPDAIGDVLHALRSSLNHLIEAASIQAGGVVQGSEFPVFIDRDAYRATDRRTGRPSRTSGLFKLRGVPPALAAEVERLQPFHDAEPAEHPLWVLHQLAILDRHRLPLLVPVVVDQVGLLTPPVQRVHFRGSFKLGAFSPGEEIARTSVGGLHPAVRRATSHTVRVSLGFPAEVPGGGSSVVGLLRGIHDHIRDVVFLRCDPLVDERR